MIQAASKRDFGKNAKDGMPTTCTADNIDSNKCESFQIVRPTVSASWLSSCNTVDSGICRMHRICRVRVCFVAGGTLFCYSVVPFALIRMAQARVGGHCGDVCRCGSGSLARRTPLFLCWSLSSTLFFFLNHSGMEC